MVKGKFQAGDGACGVRTFGPGRHGVRRCAPLPCWPPRDPLRRHGAGPHQALQLRNARAAIGAAAQGLLQLRQPLVGIATAARQRILDGRLADVETSAHLAPALGQ